jgi:hypothetical protein
MPAHPMYPRQGLAPLGLVAGMCDARGSGEALAQATRQDPARRALTVGAAVQAMGLQGLGFSQHARARGPRFCPPPPPPRRMAPPVAPAQRPDAAWGRACETRSPSGGTALSSLGAVRAAQRLGLVSPGAPRATTRCHGDGRAHSAPAPDAQGGPLTRGSSRAPRPAWTHVRRAGLVAPQAGLPLLRPPLRGTRSAGPEGGPLVKAPSAPWPPPTGPRPWGPLGPSRAPSTSSTVPRRRAHGSPAAPRPCAPHQPPGPRRLPTPGRLGWRARARAAVNRWGGGAPRAPPRLGAPAAAGPPPGRYATPEAP